MSFLVFILLITQAPIGAGQNVYAEDEFYLTNNVEHLFTHCLVAYPEIAFKNENTMKKSYDTDCITPSEFIKILQSLYDNNYVLVNLYDCFKVENGIAIKQKVKVPKGKKPLILSFDDVNYDHKKMGLGMVDKLILDEYGNIASLTKIEEKQEIRYDNEFLPILENFIKKHPGFSPYGAKGTINLTGYDGILGYRTSHTNNTNQKEEIAKAQEVVNKIKALGWNFACHSYGHYHMKKISDTKFAEEIANWKKEVEPIIGSCTCYVYPYGEWEVFVDGGICPKHQMLIDAGFSLFCGVGMKTYFSYLPNKNGNKVLFMDRKVIDGTTLRADSKYLKPFFNPALVLDYQRPLSI